jgi:hypothetical protein
MNMSMIMCAGTSIITLTDEQRLQENERALEEKAR